MKWPPEEGLSTKSPDATRNLPKDVRRSLAFLLVSVSLWFISYNAVETWFTTYATLFVALTFVTMLFVKHEDTKAKAMKGTETFDIDL